MAGRIAKIKKATVLPAATVLMYVQYSQNRSFDALRFYWHDIFFKEKKTTATSKSNGE